MSISIQNTCMALAFSLAMAWPMAGVAEEGAGTGENMSAAAEALMSLDGSTEAATEAPTGWHICDIVRTGAGWGNHYVALTCPGGPFTNKWHIMSDAQKDQMLATALSAATSGNKVQVYIHGQSGYNQIRALYLHK